MYTPTPLGYNSDHEGAIAPTRKPNPNPNPETDDFDSLEEENADKRE